MTYDQKPSRIKLVSTGGPARTPAQTDTSPLEKAIEQAVENAQQADAEPAPARRFSLVSALLFLAGCAIGGAGLAAWPHLAG